MSDNDLSSTSATFTGLSKLTRLDLSDNDLTAIAAGSLAPLTALTRLDLSNNEIDLTVAISAYDTTTPNIFTGLSALTHLDLSNNEIDTTATNTLHHDTFKGLTALTSLDLSNNGLITLRTGTFASMTKLQRLNLEDNALVPTQTADGDNYFAMVHLPTDLFAGMTSLQSVRMRSASQTPAGSHIIIVSLAWRGGDWVATAHPAAPFPITVTVTKTGYHPGTETVTIPRGSKQSSGFAVNSEITDDITLAGTKLEITTVSAAPTTTCSGSPCFTGLTVVKNHFDAEAIEPHLLDEDHPALTKPAAAPSTLGGPSAYSTEHPCTALPTISSTVTATTFASKNDHVTEYAAPSGDCKVEVRLRPNPNIDKGGSCTVAHAVTLNEFGLSLRPTFTGDCAWVHTYHRMRLWRAPSSSGSSSAVVDERAPASTPDPNEAAATEQFVTIAEGDAEPSPHTHHGHSHAADGESGVQNVPDFNDPSKWKQLPETTWNRHIMSRVTGVDPIGEPLWRFYIRADWDYDGKLLEVDAYGAKKRFNILTEIADTFDYGQPTLVGKALNKTRPRVEDILAYAHGGYDKIPTYFWRPPDPSQKPRLRTSVGHWPPGSHKTGHTDLHYRWKFHAFYDMYWYSDGFPTEDMPEVSWLGSAKITGHKNGNWTCIYNGVPTSLPKTISLAYKKKLLKQIDDMKVYGWDEAAVKGYKNAMRHLVSYMPDPELEIQLGVDAWRHFYHMSIEHECYFGKAGLSDHEPTVPKATRNGPVPDVIPYP